MRRQGRRLVRGTGLGEDLVQRLPRRLGGIGQLPVQQALQVLERLGGGIGVGRQLGRGIERAGERPPRRRRFRMVRHTLGRGGQVERVLGAVGSAVRLRRKHAGVGPGEGPRHRLRMEKRRRDRRRRGEHAIGGRLARVGCEARHVRVGQGAGERPFRLDRVVGWTRLRLYRVRWERRSGDSRRLGGIADGGWRKLRRRLSTRVRDNRSSRLARRAFCPLLDCRPCLHTLGRMLRLDRCRLGRPCGNGSRLRRNGLRPRMRGLCFATVGFRPVGDRRLRRVGRIRRSQRERLLERAIDAAFGPLGDLRDLAQTYGLGQGGGMGLLTLVGRRKRARHGTPYSSSPESAAPVSQP